MEKENKIISMLNENGYVAYMVGGYVRDYMLGIKSYDVDIATSASYDEAKEILSKEFSSIEEVGKQFGVLLVDGVEVAQFREESYEDNSFKPSSVQLTRSAKSDALRRDFTINALYMENSSKIIDLLEGQSLDDIENKVIRAVGNPHSRFKEDSSRIIRAVYLASKLNFTIEENTLQAMKNLKENVKQVPNELKGKLLLKAIKGGNFSKFIEILFEEELMGVFIPQLAHLKGLPQSELYHKYHEDVSKHVIDVIKQTEKVYPKDIKMLLSALFHDVAKGLEGIRGLSKRGYLNDLKHEEKGEEISYNVLISLGLGKELAKSVSLIVKHHGLPLEKTLQGQEKSIIKLFKKVRSDFKTVEELQEFLITIAEFKTFDSHSMVLELKENSLSAYENAKILIPTLIKKQPLYVNQLEITGKDIMENTQFRGVYVGKMLQHLLNVGTFDTEKLQKVMLKTSQKTLDTQYK